MSDGIGRHRELERRLKHMRRANGGLESSEEEGILDEMEELWWQLSEEERKVLDKDDPESLIRPSPQPQGDAQDGKREVR